MATKPQEPKQAKPQEPKQPKQAKKGDKDKKSKEKAPEAVVSNTAVEAPRKRKLYHDQAIAELTKQFSFKNPMQVPRLRKITVNMGLGAAVGNPKIIDSATDELRAITGQKPVVTRAKKAIATFKLREGVPIGVMVTLRRERMWEFLDRLVSIALPRVRDFKGVSPRGFDGNGNYTLGLKEQIIFPEIDYDKIDAIKGLNISFVTSAKNDAEGRALLTQLGMPFRA
jgi:large subunit ribosomal protein L5